MLKLETHDNCVDKGIACEGYIRNHSREKFLMRCKNDRIKTYCKKSCGVCNTGMIICTLGHNGMIFT